MEEMAKLIIGGIGGILGFVAFIWRVIDQFKSYLHISLKVRKENDTIVTTLTTVENKSMRSKKLDYAVLLVGPESENPVETAKMIAKCFDPNPQITYTNDIVKLKTDDPIYHEGRALIPLPFFYNEQINIGDEKLTYKSLIDTSQIDKGIPYAVRFFIFGKGRLHRSTQDLFIVR